MSEMSGNEEGTGDVVVSRGSAPSVLSSLKEKRQEVLDKQVLPLRVPRWDDPVILVRYKPVEHGLIRAAQNRVNKASADKKAEIEIEANADILISGCLAVVAVVDGKEYSLRPGDELGEPTRFDRDLAQNLGIEGEGGKPPTARMVVRGLFITGGDVLSAANEVVKFSGYKETEADEAILGE